MTAEKLITFNLDEIIRYEATENSYSPSPLLKKKKELTTFSIISPKNMSVTENVLASS